MWENFQELISEIGARPLASMGIVLNLILIESLLSIDNAAVLATMVLDLPKDQRRRALRYGIVGAYIFRGICLLFASLLIQIWWFKPVGGIYLLVLAIRNFLPKPKKEEGPEDDVVHKERTWLYKKTLGALGPFWATVVLVELMDLAFSIDNVIAANAYSSNLILIWTGVFIGILAMRFVAQGFVHLMERFPFLETCAYLVILILGLKLTLSIYTHFYPLSEFSIFLEGKASTDGSGNHAMHGEVLTTVLSISIFLIPLITSWLFNWPKKHKVIVEED